jgi:hypothetical protein
MEIHGNEYHTPDFLDTNHATDTTSVHNFDASGKAPAQNHGNTAHTSTFVTQSEIDASIATHAGAADPHTVYQKESERGSANGYAPLDLASKVPTANLGGAGASGTNFLRGDQTWAVPPGGSGGSELWEGKIHVAMYDGNPLAEPFQVLSSNTTISPVVTPTNIGIAVGRLVAFRFKTAITVATIRWYGIAAVSAIYTAAIYRDSDGARLWAPTNVNTTANAWGSSTAGLPITLDADTLYWFGIGADTTGTTAGFCTPALPRVAAFGLATPAWAGLTTVGLRFCQVTLSAGVWPATLPAKVNAGAWTGFVPAFYLCATGF